MEDVEVDGLVVRDVKTGEADKIVTLLTAQRGRITVSGKGVNSLKNRHAASTQLFSYSTFLLRRRGDFWYIRDTYYIESFEKIRYDLEKLSLANYICEVANDLAPENMEAEELLALTLNTLYALANRDQLPLEQIKGAFEFRAAVQEGFMPNLSGCGHCGAKIGEDGVLDVMNGILLCPACRTLTENDPEFLREAEVHASIRIPLTPAVLAALRYLETAPVKRFLSFALDPEELSLFSATCERYLLNHLEHGFSSLEYLKKIRNGLPGGKRENGTP